MRIFVKSQVKRLNLKSKSVCGGCVELNYEVRLKDDNSAFVNQLEAMPAFPGWCLSPTTAIIWDKAMIKSAWIDRICIGAAALAALLAILLMFGEPLGLPKASALAGVCVPPV